MVEEQLTKYCTKCNIAKPFSEFNKNKLGKNGVRSHCKKCSKFYRIENKSTIDISNKNLYERKKCLILSQKKEYYFKNKKAILLQKSEYYHSNSKEIAVKRQKYAKTDIGKSVNRNSNHKRRAIFKKSDITSIQYLELQQNAKTCYWCSVSLKNKEVHIDHLYSFNH